MRMQLILVGLLTLPLITFAQIGDIGDTASEVYCPNLTVTMQFGATDATTGGQVTQLQRFLADYYDLNPADYVTGSFRRLTRENVRRFQCETMSVCSGSEVSTGWGRVGPMTRVKIADTCGVGTQTYSSPTSPYTPQPQQPTTQSCTTPWGTRIAHGVNVTAYAIGAGTTYPPTCYSEVRTCTNGTLSGSYTREFCRTPTSAATWSTGEWSLCTNNQQTRMVVCKSDTIVPDSYCTGEKPLAIQSCVSNSSSVSPNSGQTPTSVPTNQSCTTPWNSSVAHGASVTAYQTVNVPYGQSCTSETRSCTSGTLSGSYIHSGCTIDPPPTTYSWYVSEWSQCASSQKNRTVQCTSSTGAVVVDSYCTSAKPVVVQSCVSQSSPTENIVGFISYGYGVTNGNVRYGPFIVTYLTLNQSLTRAQLETSRLEYGDGVVDATPELPVCYKNSDSIARSSDICRPRFDSHTYTQPGTYTVRFYYDNNVLGATTSIVVSI